MNSSAFNVRIVIHSVLIAVTASAFIWTLSREYLVVTRLSLGFVWILQIIWLIRYINQTNRNLLHFLQSFEYEDDTVSFNKQRRLPFSELYSEFNRIADQFKKVKLDREAEHNYFQYSIRHVDTGLLSFDREGNIELMNDAAKALLNIEFAIKLDDLGRVSPSLAFLLNDLNPGQMRLLKTGLPSTPKAISFRATEFMLKDRWIKLVAMQDIQTELDNQEIESWQKLIRVLNHEIINSIGPISILSSSLLKTFESVDKSKNVNKVGEDSIKDTVDGLRAIHRRSSGLMQFVEQYKTLAKVPQAEITTIQLGSLIRNIEVLFKSDFEEKEIGFETQILPEKIAISTDPKLLEQVLVNLVKNAIEAFNDYQADEKAVISISAREQNEVVAIEITDNGPGMPAEIAGQIFVPFFTTKAHGSGIGLNLGRQIVSSLNGRIEVQTTEGAGTTIFLFLNNR